MSCLSKLCAFQTQQRPLGLDLDITKIAFDLVLPIGEQPQSRDCAHTEARHDGRDIALACTRPVDTVDTGPTGRGFS